MEDKKFIVDDNGNPLGWVDNSSTLGHKVPSVPPFAGYVWDFDRRTWLDSRNLIDWQKQAAWTVRNHFESVAWQVLQEFVPQYEMDSWRIQLEEAKAFHADQTYATPCLDAILQYRTDVTKEELVQRILTNDAEYRVKIGETVGRCHAALYRIATAKLTRKVDEVLLETVGSPW